jgi:signal peptidase I
MTKENTSQPSPAKNVSPKETHESWWVEGVKTLGLALMLAFGIRTFVAEARFIPTGSMEPTLMVDDRLLVDKIGYRLGAPVRGDIVVFDPTDALQKDGFKEAFIKRIIGLPGDRVSIVNSRVFINGKRLAEPYIDASLTTSLMACGGMPAFLDQPQTIPADSYLVLGDNRDNSFDGRCWGVVPRKNIIGRAAIRFWPLNRMSLIPGGTGE